MAATWTRGQLWDKVVEQAQKNPKYYDMLMSDPRGLMEKQLGVSIPSSVNIKVVEEAPDTYYIVLPHFAREGAELSDADLEKVAGGKGLPPPPDPLGLFGGGDSSSGGGGSSSGGGSFSGGGLPGGGMSGGGGGAASCQATGSAVGTTIVDISL